MSCDYRHVASPANARENPGWLYDLGEEKQWPAWTVQLTAGTDREGQRFMLDTTDGTIAMYCCGGHFKYPPTYRPDDPRGWRDSECYLETVTLKELLEKWRKDYRQMTVLTSPEDCSDDGYGSPDPSWGDFSDESESYNFKEMHSLRTIYREHGWPDEDRYRYRKEACIEALKHWRRGSYEADHERTTLEVDARLEQLRIAQSEDLVGEDTKNLKLG